MKICSSEKEFIATVAPYAQRACKRFEVELGQPFYLPSVLVAQACKEVGYAIPSYWDNPGVRGLVEENNMVGIKRSLLNSSWTDIGLGCWDGKYLSKKTPEVYDGKPVIITDDFRIYRDPEQSFMDYLCFMRWGGYSVGNPKYYPKIKDLHDYRSLIRQVHALGYATGPTYASGVISIIEKHGLTVYDDLRNVTPSAYWPSGAGGSADMVDNIIINKNPMGVRTHNTSKRSDSIKYICIHYVGGLGDAKANIDYYNQPSTTEASADFYVGHDGTIWQYNVEPTNRYCWAVGGKRQSSYGGSLYGICKNANSISIEMCVKSKSGKAPANPNDKNWYLTDQTYQGAVKLTKYLMKVYSIPEDRVIRHFDVNGKLCLPIDKTELLTPNGWIGLGDVEVGDEVAQYTPDDDSITFAKVLDVVEKREDIVYKNRYMEATADHRMYVKPNCVNSKEFRDVPWGDVLQGTKSYVIKTAAYLDTKGINLTDDEIRLLVWIQGDGHYMVEKRNEKSPGIQGIEFHLKKERKIARIINLLDEMGIPYSLNKCKNGSVHIRTYGKKLYRWAETWLTNKVFNYNLMWMSQDQFEVFWQELVFVDGNDESQLYTSSIDHNNDVVQAICALHGKRSSKITMGNAGSGGKNTVLTANTNHTVGRGSTSYPVEKRKTTVSCVTVPSGYILARINDKTFIVGNCPGIVGWNSASGSEAEWKRFKNDIIGASPAPTPTPTGKIWKVQLGAYQRRGNALNKLIMAQEKIAKDAFITDLQDGYYRVQVGSFSVYQNAVNLRDSIINRKLSDAIIKEYNA